MILTLLEKHNIGTRVFIEKNDKKLWSLKRKCSISKDLGPKLRVARETNIEEQVKIMEGFQKAKQQ